MTDLLSAPLLDTSPIADQLRNALPTDVDYASARLFDERSEHLTIRQNNLEPIFNEFDTGVMISIWNGGGLGYAATTDLSEAGLRAARTRIHKRVEDLHVGVAGVQDVCLDEVDERVAIGMRGQRCANGADRLTVEVEVDARGEGDDGPGSLGRGSSL